METPASKELLLKILEEGEGKESALPRYYGVKKKKKCLKYFSE